MEQHERDNLSQIYLHLTAESSTYRAEIAVLQAEQAHIKQLLEHYVTREMSTDHEGRLRVVEAAITGYKKLCYVLIASFLMAAAATVWQAVQKVERMPTSQPSQTRGQS